MEPEIVIQLVNFYKGKLTQKTVLDALNVSRTTYNRWVKNIPKKKEDSNLIKLIKTLCHQNKFRYGYRKITYLVNKEMKANKNTVQRIMQKYDLNCKVRLKRRKSTGQPLKIVENIINVDFNATRPLEKLSTDITYLPFGKSMLYLSSIMDLYNREIIAYTISDKQDLECVLDTLNQLPNISEHCILHSDQGAVYTAHSYQMNVKEKGITMSMSRPGKPSDNAPIETFHGYLKHETFYLEPQLKSSNEIVSQTVIQYIKYYNEDRIQEKLGYRSPKEFRELQTSS